MAETRDVLDYLKKVLHDAKQRILAMQEERSEPIAIVSMACRYPGGCTSPEKLWELFHQGREALSSFPRQRDSAWDPVRLYDPDPDAVGKSITQVGGFLQDVDEFDARFFGISPREAVAMDPQQRLLLEVSWEALERAGQLPGALFGSRTGVYIGSIYGDYGNRLSVTPESLDGYVGTGSYPSVASGRIAYALGLQGPAITVDTACSSSLVAVHLACQALRNGECDRALAGGVTVLATPSVFIEFSRLRGLAPDGRCKAFSAAADGIGISEGCGLLLLERLSEARRHGHPVLALIRGSAVNQDGRSQGLTAPNGPAQERVIEDALRAAGLSPDQVDAVEAHGTGTRLGDPIEAQAVIAKYGPGHSSEKPLWLGSAKSNLGHTQAAAGVAGIMKIVLALKHGKLPKTLHADLPSEQVDWGHGQVRLLQEEQAWVGGAKLRRAAVSSFGISGTNAHMILEEYPAGKKQAPEVATASLPRAVPLFLSAPGEAGLRAQSQSLIEHLESHPKLRVLDLAHALATRRTQFPVRLALPVNPQAEPDLIAAALKSFVQGQALPGLSLSRPGQIAGRVAVLFSGQGSQLPGMGLGLYRAYAVFREALDSVCALLERPLGRALSDIMFAAAGSAEAALLDQTAFTQAALFAISVAQYRLWEHWGLRPELLLGHSIGELAAVHLAGALSLKDACALVAARGKMMQAMPTGGAMAAVQASEAEVLVQLQGRHDQVAIAAINEPAQTVISGDLQAVEAVASDFEQLGRRVKRLRTSHAFHSPHMEGMLDGFGKVVEGLKWHAAKLPIVSSVTGKLSSPDDLGSPDYWIRQVRQPVRFMEGIQTLHQEGATVYIECGPQATLCAMAGACLAPDAGVLVASQRPASDAVEAIVAAVGAAHVAGVPLDHQAIFAGHGGEEVPLPTYAFQRQRYWLTAPPVGRAGLAAAGLEDPEHPLLGSCTTLPEGGFLFTSCLSGSTHAWLYEHTILGKPLFPGTAFLELALAAGQRAGTPQVAALVIERPLVLPADGALRLQLKVEAASPQGSRAFAVLTCADTHLAATWTCHASGELAPEPPAPAPPTASFGWPPQGAEPVALLGLYERLAAFGINYGPAFQGLKELYKDSRSLYARVVLPEQAGPDARAFFCHPALLDAALQSLVAAHGDRADVELLLPYELQQLRLYARGAQQLRVQITLNHATAAEQLEAGLMVLDENGHPVAELGVLRARRVTALQLGEGENPQVPLYRPEWEARTTTALETLPEAWAVLGSGPLAERAARVFSQKNVAVRQYVGVSELLQELSAGGLSPQGIVWTADPTAGPDPVTAAHEATVALLGDLQLWATAEPLRASRLVLLTERAVSPGDSDGPIDLGRAPLWGLLRVAGTEYLDREVRAVDSDDSAASEEILAAALMAGGEPEAALRRGVRLVPRLKRASATDPYSLVPPAGPHWRLQIQSKGHLDALTLGPAPDLEAPLEPGQVRIAVHAAGVNFRDVLNALGMYPGAAGPLGVEGAGVVMAIGPGVMDLLPNQRVMGLIPASFGPISVTDHRLLVPIPSGLSFAEAATIPGAFLTAYYGLFDLAQLQAGEKLLIHAAAGGVGLAALQLAQHRGVEVFATAHPAKWPLLRELGVPADHLASSRSLDFHSSFLHATQGRGVDVVLNSLAGDFVDASLGLLRRGGRFVEMGKTDLRDSRGVAERHPGVRYQAFDMLEVSPERVRQMLIALVALLEEGAVRPLPHRTSDLRRASEVFKRMAQGKHTGKLVLRPPQPLRPDGTVLVTGGTGGVGRLLARHLATHYRVKHLLLTSRQGPAAQGAAELLIELAAAGCQAEIAACDIGDGAAVSALLSGLSPERPLTAVFHTAGSLDDGALTTLNGERIATVFRAKVAGAWNLHRLTQGHDLSAFVLFSSVAGIIGNAGQGNYAAANAFMDALASYRQAAGLPATSLAWGFWEEVGMAARLSAMHKSRLHERGLLPMSTAEALSALDLALQHAEPLLLPMRIELTALGRNPAPSSAGTRLRTLFQIPARAVAIAQASGGSFLQQLAARSGSERLPLVIELVRQELAAVLQIPQPATLGLDLVLKDLGIDSLTAVELRNRLTARTGISLPATLSFDYPTIRQLAANLLERLPSKPPGTIAGPAPRASAAARAAVQPIAVIGVGCRFPGGIQDGASFWQLLEQKRDAMQEVPPERWDIEALYDPDPDAVGKMVTRRGGFLERIDQFDASFFGIAPREAVKMDPQQRLLLEVSWEALEDAGLPVEKMLGSATGVFIGHIYSEYDQLLGGALESLDGYVATGSAGSVAAGRISYTLGLKGPSLAVDTACSSSLVALHLACQSLRTGESDVALAGGVTVVLSPRAYVEFSRLHGLAPDGRCKSFAAAADGVAWSEGCGVIVLKRLADAERAGDRVLAVIRATAVNQDGKSNGLTAPNGPAQEQLLRQALSDAGVDPLAVGYVEAHGTGTALGDPTEMQALANVYAAGRPADRPLVVGAVKSNFGHTQAAAGIAGVIKAVLALQHEAIPANLHFETPSPHIPWRELAVQVPTELMPWPRAAGPRLAGVSSFGISGTNAHVLLEEAPSPPAAPDRQQARALQLLTLSAKSTAGLRDLASRYARHLTDNPQQPLADVAYTAAMRRSHQVHRFAAVESTHGQLAAQLTEFARGESRREAGHQQKFSEARKLVLVFPGQGGQWAGMGRSLLREPVFRGVIEDCERAMSRFQSWSLAEMISGEGKDQELELERVEVIQPALFAMQVGLAALWRSLGVTPQAVIGHSMGEIAAACVAGALTLEDACQVVCVRSQLVRRASGHGGMVAVALGEVEVRPFLTDYLGRLEVGVINGPHSTVLSGEPQALNEVMARLAESGVFCRRVKVDYASHSPQMEALRADLIAQLRTVKARRPELPLYSTVTGRRRDELLDAEYWQQNLAQPVQFWSALERLAEDGFDTFVEMNPHPILPSALEEGLSDRVPGLTVVSSMRRGTDELAQRLSALGRLYTAGYPLDWTRLISPGSSVVSLPKTAWQRQRYWIDKPAARASAPARQSPQGAWRLGGSRIDLPGDVIHRVLSVGPQRPAYLADHTVFGRPVVAGAFFIAVVLAVAAEQFGATSATLREVQFIQPLILDADTDLQVMLQPADATGYTFSIATAQPAASSNAPSWRVHVKGSLLLGAPVAAADLALQELRQQCPRSVPLDAVFDFLDARQVHWGPRWRQLAELHAGGASALAKLLPSESLMGQGPLHPALIDNAFVTALGSLLGTAGFERGAPYLPWMLHELRWHGRPEGELWCHCRLQPELSMQQEALTGSGAVFAAGGRVVLSVNGLLVKRVPADLFFHSSMLQRELLYEVAWRPAALDTAEKPAPARGCWLLLCPAARAGQVLREQLAAAGQRVIVAQPGESFRRLAADHYVLNPRDGHGYQTLLHEAFSDGRACAGVVHMWSLDALGQEPASPADLRRDLALGTHSALFLVQALAQSGWSSQPRLWLVTAGVQDIADTPATISLSQAPLWGLGQAIAVEYPGLSCARVDLSALASEPELRSLSSQILSGETEPRVALRGDRRYVARLIRSTAARPAPPATAQLRPDASYLITGGLGGLGLATAELLASRGARHLVLAGRNPPGLQAQQAAQRLGQAGTTVAFAAVDVSEPVQVAALVGEFGQTWPALRGVFHCAAVVLDRVLANQSAEVLEQNLAAKMFGAWNLHAATAACELDYFVGYSSVVALFGGAGQSGYAAANAFVDSLAHYRRRKGQPALSINWGGFAEIGIAAQRLANERFVDRGMEPLAQGEGMEILSALLAWPVTQAAVVRLEPQKFSHFADNQSTRWFLLELLSQQAPAPDRQQLQALRGQLLSGDEGPKQVLLESYLQQLVAAVLRLSGSQIESATALVQLGIDSLMALELRNRIDSDLRVTVQTAFLLNGATIASIAKYLIENLVTPAAVAADPEEAVDMEEVLL